ncbi:MAG: type II methionyl aminopeptidase [Methanoregulaceae archaeon]
MNAEIFDEYCEAGKIAARVLRRGAERIRPGVTILEVVEFVESDIKDAGAGLAFPLNLSRNEDAAHDTASRNDDRIFAPGDVVKLDLGVHVNGYIADTALTVDLGDHGSLVEASREALEQAIAKVRPGCRTGELGTTINAVITARGFRPVANLTGHGLGKNLVHTSPSIPNIPLPGGQMLEEGMVFAIEPFATTGTGRVGDKNRVEIFRQIADRPARLHSARAILESVRERQGMPFSKRWLPGDHPDVPLATLIRSGILYPFPVLADIPGSFVSQAEHTLIVTGDGCIVTTR